MRKIKIFSILLCMMILCSFVLAGCNNGTPTVITARWADSETFSYTVREAMLKASPLFKVEKDDLTFVNNFELVAEAGVFDEFKPSVVTGTFDGEISTQTETQTFESRQYIECSYRLEDLDVEAFDLLTSYIDGLDGSQKALIVVSTSDSEIVLKSETITKTVFEKNNKQTPVSSEKTLKGYYAGASKFEVNDIVCSTTYEGSTATVTIISNGQKTVDGEKRSVGASTFIDASQILLYQRSLDQSVAFTQATGIVVYDPITDQSVGVSFSINLKTPTILNLGNGENLAMTTFIAASVSSGLLAANLYAFFNNPNDKLPVTAAGELNKYTPVKWQCGWLLYELASYTSEEVEQLAYVSEE